MGFPIRIPRSQRPFAPRAGLSGLGPSFVAGGCLGIPRVHSFAYSYVPTIKLDLLSHEQLESTFSISASSHSVALLLILGFMSPDFHPAEASRWTLSFFSQRPEAPSGAKETRTPNIQLAKLALYQLSYNPLGYGPEWT